MMRRNPTLDPIITVSDPCAESGRCPEEVLVVSHLLCSASMRAWRARRAAGPSPLKSLALIWKVRIIQVNVDFIF